MIIYAVDIQDHLSQENIERLLNRVSFEKRKKLLRMRFKKDIIRGAVGERLINLIIEKKLGISQDDVRFLYNSYGKPYIDNIKDFYFNISHSGNWVLGAIDKEELGIDVEKKGNYGHDIAHRFFALQEQKYLSNQHEDDFEDNFIRIWTLKESFIKAIGKGLSIPLNSFSVVNEDMQWKRKLGDWRLESFELDSDHTGALCHKSLKESLIIQRYRIRDIVEKPELIYESISLN